MVTVMVNQQPLKLSVAVQMSAAIEELNQLSAEKIITPEKEARQKGLQQFLNDSLAQHADHLLATFIACVTEYEPLLKGIAGVLRRANGMNAELAARQQPPIGASQASGANAVAAPAENETNIVSLKQ